jgi:hypothetical protein
MSVGSSVGTSVGRSVGTDVADGSVVGGIDVAVGSDVEVGGTDVADGCGVEVGTAVRVGVIGVAVGTFTIGSPAERVVGVGPAGRLVDVGVRVGRTTRVERDEDCSSVVGIGVRLGPVTGRRIWVGPNKRASTVIAAAVL